MNSEYHKKPLAIDLYAGLGGWSEALLAEGWRVIGFDIEAHDYGTGRYPGRLVLQDVLTLHGSQFKSASLIVASPPCQAYSYRAMPWSRAKALPPPDNTLFEACFRIQREAIEAAGHYIPLIVENVRGAQKWVGRAKWNFGSYYLWGDVPALMPITLRARKSTENSCKRLPGAQGGRISGWPHIDEGQKQPGRNFHFPEKYGIPSPSFHGSEHEPSVRDALALTNQRESEGVKLGESPGKVWNDRPAGNVAAHREGTKNGGDWFGSGENCSAQRKCGSKSNSRKAASAMIAKIPYPLAQHIAQVFMSETL